MSNTSTPPPAFSQRRRQLLNRLLEHAESAKARETIPRREEEGPGSLSFTPQQLWLLHQLEPGSPFYNLPGALSLSGPLDAAALERSLHEIARRHEALRTVFPMREGGPVQVVLAGFAPELDLINLEGLPEAEQNDRVEKIIAKESRLPFDLATGP